LFIVEFAAVGLVVICCHIGTLTPCIEAVA